VAQLERRNEIQGKRQRLFSQYLAAAKSWSNFAPISSSGESGSAAAHLFFIRLPNQVARDSLIQDSRERGVNIPFHYQALHLSTYAKNHAQIIEQRLPIRNSERASVDLVRLPMWSEMTTAEVERVLEVVDSFMIRSYGHLS
jgi:dTDP-4-amino-4,6-dideoxygalactose transaminase